VQHLTDILLSDGVRQRLVTELADLIEQEVAGGTGVAGLAVRSGYRLVTSIRADFVRRALEDMVAAFVAELDPLYAEHGRPGGFAEYLASHRAHVARQVLEVADARRATVRSAPLRSAYDALVPLARAKVERSVPRLGQVIQRYVDEALGAGDPALCFDRA
jgi:hypothetical protein